MGKQVPANIEAEQFVLGSILLDGQRFAEVSEALGVEDFHLTGHKLIFERMADLARDGESIDALTLAEALRKRDQIQKVGDHNGGIAYIMGLTDGLPLLDSIESHVRIVKDKSILRQLIEAAEKIRNDALSSGAESEEEVSKALQALTAIDVGTAKRGLEHVGRLIADRGKEEFLHPSESAKGIPTPWTQLNWMLPGDGFLPGELVFIAARPGVGKTVMGLSLALSASKTNPVAFYTLEMGWDSIARRALTELSGIPGKQIRSKALSGAETARMDHSFKDLVCRKLLVNDQTDVSVDVIGSQCSKAKARNGLSMVVVDYLGLLKMPKADRDDLRYAEATRSLKMLAKNLGVPVIALAQLNRDAVAKGRAGLENLAGGDSIGRDADVVLILEEKKDIPDQRLLRVTKVRDGQTGNIDLYWQPEVMRLRELADMEDAA